MWVFEHYMMVLLVLASSEMKQSVWAEAQADSPADIRAGFLLETGAAEIFDRIRIQPAVDVALETVRQRVQDGSYANFTISYVFQSTGPRCIPSAMTAPGVASNLYHRHRVNVLIGPGCSFQCKAVADLAAYWNIPVLSGASTSGDLDNKAQYKTLTRTAFQMGVMGHFSVALFQQWSWSRCSIIWDDIGVWRIISDSIRSRLEDADIYVNPVVLSMHESTEEALEAAANRGRIIYIIAPVGIVRDIMVKAYRQGYTNGEFVFFSVHIFNNRWRFGDSSWKQGDEYDVEARLAFKALMTFRLFQPTNDGFVEFQAELERRRLRDFNWTSPPGDDFNFFTSAFHDVIILFSLAVNETLGENGNLSDGYALTRKMWNRTFEGISGLVTVNDNGDRDADYSLWDYTTDEEEDKVVYHFYGATRQLEFVSDIEWPGGATQAPPDTPPCGFYNENPACLLRDSTMTTAIVTASCIVVVGLIIIIVIYRRLKLAAELQSRAWQIKWEELQMNDNAGRRSSNFSTGSLSLKSEERNQLFIKTAFYQGRTVAVKKFSVDRVDVNKSILKELKNMRDLEHPNLVRFVGLCLDNPNVAIINEYCQKGSLLDILHNDSIKLDWLFKYSLISDVIKGMQYLHRSPLSVHGRLNSSNCLVDSRFVLKLVDFGLHTLRSEGSKESNDDHAALRKMLWVAPELLREPNQVTTKEGDIYSIGIIVREVATREEPYEAESTQLGLTEILDKIKTSFSTTGQAFRPQVADDRIEADLCELMKTCWAEDPKDRPSANSLNASMTQISRAKNTGKGILDNLLNRMEQYANNLEELVEERTAAFLEEKQRAETLLYELLPRIVADKLKVGKSVDPESYDNVTIFFSDIKGFTELSAQSTPMQVVVLLNDLYTCFDGIIEHFDVYKVETIGDAYMVVSGVPVRNGNAHAREIANMALALLRAVRSFTIRHKKDKKLYLRVGVHTGPCVAGVVGLKMPRYCLFGDTVNTASRMESNGEAMKIHISSATKAVLENFDGFNIELRGAIEMKGKGTQTTFWLIGSSDVEAHDSNPSN